MTKKDLARRLRVFQYRLGMVSRTKIDAQSDDESIRAYITCPDCGEVEIDGPALERSIAQATSAKSWFNFLDALERAKAMKSQLAIGHAITPHWTL